jgi:periplasmic protein TonB
VKRFSLLLAFIIVALAIPLAAQGQSGRRSGTQTPVPAESPQPPSSATGTKPDDSSTNVAGPPVSLPTEVNGEKVYKYKDLDSKAVIKRKPEPVYTEEARRYQVEGTVVLRAVLSSTGAVTNITVVRGLPHGLSEAAIKAARKIEFKPGMKDGKPAAMWVEIQYRFWMP